MLIGVVSDTHGHVAYAQEAVRMLEEFAPAAVIHCGDVGSADIVPLFSAWKTHFVAGNVDEGCDEIPAAVRAAGQTWHGAFGHLAIGGRKVAFLHGHDHKRLRREIAGGAWDLLCYGHTHCRDVRREGHTVVLNPGALYRADPHSLALVELDTLEVTPLSL